MSASTVYDVRLRYLMEDRASGGVKALDRGLQSAARSSGFLSGALARAGAAAAGFFGLRAAKSALVDFNADLEQSKITMSGLMQLNAGGEFADNMARAEHLVGRLQERAKASVGTTKDMVEMSAMLMQPLTAARASMKDIEDLTVGSVVAARAFGIAADVAARDVDQALRGMFRSVDPFTGKLLGPMGFVGEEGRAKFNQLAADKRMGVVRKALTQQAIRDMAGAQETSFAGVMSTFQDSLQMTFGKIGKPLFQSLTAEVQKWNKWIDENKDRIESMALKMGQHLSAAFSLLKDVGAFFASHGDTLIALAKAFVALKVISGTAGLVSGAAGLASAVPAFAASLTAASGTMISLFGPAGLVAGAILGFVALVRASSAMDRARQAPFIEAAEKYQEFRRVSGRMSADEINVEAVGGVTRKLAQFAKENSLLTADSGQFRPDFKVGMLEALNQYGFDPGDKGTVTFVNAMTQFSRDVQEGRIQLATLLGERKGPMSELPQSSKTGKGTQKVNVTINRIEVKSDDPDRWVFGMEQAFRDLSKNPAGAFSALRGEG